MPTNFVRDNTSIPGPKVQYDGISLEGSAPLMFCNSDDYNALRSATIDLRGWVQTGLTPGTYAAATLIVDSDGRITGVAAGSAVPADGSITNAKLANMGANTLKGSIAGGVPADLSASQARGVLGLATIATSGSGADLTANTVTYAKQAQAAASTFSGNNTGSTANKVDMTVAQATTLLGLPSSFSSSLALAGSGKDGPISPSGSSTTTITKDMAWTTFTVPSAGCIVKTKGFVPFIQAIDLSSGGTVVFHHDGDAASGSTGASGMVSEGSLSVNSGSGASGLGNAGQPGLIPINGTWPTSDRAGIGGDGAAGGGGAGGVGGGPPSTISADTSGSVNDFGHFFCGQTNYASSTKLAGGSGGGSSAGSGAASFFFGGGGGAGGGVCAVAIGKIISPANAANITVRANGGAAGTGPSGGIGGGGGGGYAGVALLSGDPATLAAIVVQANGGSGNGGNAPSGQTKRFGG